MSRAVEVRRGSYYDSVNLMQVSRTVAGIDGVAAALVAMATELNLELLTGMGFTPPQDAGPNDLVVALRAEDDAGLERARAAADAALASIGSGGGGDGGSASLSGAQLPPRTTAAAARRVTADVAVISVPGQHAFVEAMDALDAGLSVLLFSDNVSVEQEIRLKEEAARRDLLVMGPDCGTAVIGGVGLGFANVVRPGPVGLVAASGTGAQQLLCLLDAADVGVSHCLGVGGRDLSAAVAGRSTRQALTALDHDPATELIVVVSKPPAPEVADAMSEHAAGTGTPVVWALLGADRPDLTQVAAEVVQRLGEVWTAPHSWTAPPSQPSRAPEPSKRSPAAAPPAAGQPRQGPRPAAERTLHGLFAGGTLCQEAMLIASATLGEVWSNIPLRPEWALPPGTAATSGAGPAATSGASATRGATAGVDPAPGQQPVRHVLVDFGDDELTRGRPHPMIDQSARLHALAAVAADPSVSVVLLDVVLGHGAHPDPAAELAPAIAAAHEVADADGRRLSVVVSLCGTADDPQGLDRQAEALQVAGSSVHRSNAEAARTAVRLVQGLVERLVEGDDQ